MLLPACLPFGETTGDTTKATGGGTVRIEDAYAATMALVATTQLSRVFVGGPNEAFDKDATATAAEIEIALKSNASCVAISRKDAELTLNFGAGCAPPNSPIKIQGVVVATLSVDAGKSMTVTMALTDFGAADKTATGSGTLTASKTTAGLDVKIGMKMTAGTAVLDGGVNISLVASADKKSFASVAFSTVDPTTVTVDQASFTVVATAVTFNDGQCYPSSGTIAFDAKGVKANLTFDADTASTGVAQFTPPFSKKAEGKALPGFGWKCQ